MIFLGTVFYDSEDNHMFGALIMEYEKSGMVRAKLDIVDADDIEHLVENNETLGFTIKNKMLLSDSSAYYICERDKYLFFRDYVKDLQTGYVPDLVDLMKHLIRHGAYILPNYGTANFEIDPVYIGASNFKVSQSSINIYAPYLENEEWNVISLYDSANLRKREFYAAVPQEENLTVFGSSVHKIDTIQIDGSAYNVYSCDIGINAVSDVADCFINYLAFKIAEKTLYQKILERYIATVYTETTKKKYPSNSSLKSSRNKQNIVVKHSLSKFDNLDLAKELSYGPKETFASKDLELAVSFIRHVEIEIAQSESGDVLGTCIPLLSNFKEEILCHGLELLAIRAGLLGVLDGRKIETSIMTVNGGGVFGTTTITRTGW